MTDNTRRTFLTQLSLMSAGILLYKDVNGKSLSDLNTKDLSWDEIRALFPISNNSTVQFNSGSAGTMPIPVLDKLFKLIEQMNAMPPYEAFAQWQEERKNSKQRIALMLGVSSEELAYVRNTTEGLNNILMGYPFKRDDEIICANVDYPFPIFSINQRVEREGVKKVEVHLDLLNDTEEAIVQKYKNAITGNTKLILITHITHREGHILPVKKICDMAHENGVEVLLDAAHSFAHIEHGINDIGCDYYATSLHKWLNAPHGTGLLYVSKDKISKIYPLSPSDEKVKDQMVKFEYIGTRSFAHELGIGPALDFLDLTGIKAKQDRLQKLKFYWANSVSNIPAVKLHTNLLSEYSCALASFSINGKTAGEVYNQFEKDYKLHIKTTGYGSDNKFLRVTPNIFSSFKELDRLILAINEISKQN